MNVFVKPWYKKRKKLHPQATSLLRAICFFKPTDVRERYLEAICIWYSLHDQLSIPRYPLLVWLCARGTPLLAVAKFSLILGIRACNRNTELHSSNLYHVALLLTFRV